MSSLSPSEMLDPGLAPTDLLYRLFHQEGLRVYPPKPLAQECRCSRQRVADTLRMIPRAEVADMSDAGVVTVTCEFCKSAYVFDPAQIDAVYAERH
jgi:molecular chaperone Hsp33